MIVAILVVAVYGLIVRDDLIQKIMCLTIIQSVVILSFLTVGYTDVGIAPILTGVDAVFVDPIPQALMLTAIVIGVCFDSIALAIIVKLYQTKGSTRISELYER